MAFNSQYKSKQMINTAAHTGLVKDKIIAPKKTDQIDKPGNISQNLSVLVRLRNMIIIKDLVHSE